MTEASLTSTNPELEAASKKKRMSTRNRILFFVTAWFIAFMPVWFWWNTWFGRNLSDTKVAEYLQDNVHPRHIQQALVQVSERMSRHETSVKQWYPELVRLAAHPVEEVRNTDAWILGQDTTGSGFHEALLKMLNDPSPLVRGNAALSLVRYGDATGRPQIIALLHPVTLTAPISGKVVDADRPGTPIRQGGLIAKLQNDQQTAELRSPISGHIRNLFAQTGHNVAAGAEIAMIDPAIDQIWEALRALYLVGQPEDIASVTPYERDLPEIPEHIRQQAILTEKAIRDRASAAH
jgi:biotin carboxyl carrier protein